MSRTRQLVNQVTLKVKCLERSKTFYQGVAETLGFSLSREEEDHFYIDTLRITQGTNATQGAHFLFMAQNPGAVKLFYEVATSAGGKCIEAPVVKDSSQEEYKTLVLDPDGNHIEVIYRSPRYV